MNTEKYHFGIAFSGGGARGIAHIGVLKAFEEAKIYPEVVAGASAGSLIGLLYAAGISADKMMEIVEETSIFDLISPSFKRLGLSDLSKLKKLLMPYVQAEKFEDLSRPFYVSVTNLSLGRNEIVSSGPLWEVVLASCSIPILFKAREINGYLYADGGVLNNLPVEPLIKKARLLIGVNVMHVKENANLKGIGNLTNRTLELVLLANAESRLNMCNLVIAPPVENFGLFEIYEARNIYELGYEAAKKEIAAAKL